MTIGDSQTERTLPPLPFSRFALCLTAVNCASIATDILIRPSYENTESLNRDRNRDRNRNRNRNRSSVIGR
jgi:hypothetical protein